MKLFLVTRETRAAMNYVGDVFKLDTLKSVLVLKVTEKFQGIRSVSERARSPNLITLSLSTDTLSLSWFLFLVVVALIVNKVQGMEWKMIKIIADDSFLGGRTIWALELASAHTLVTRNPLASTDAYQFLLIALINLIIRKGVCLSSGRRCNSISRHFPLYRNFGGLGAIFTDCTTYKAT